MKNRDKIDKSNIIGVQGGKHVTYDGLLDLAHKEGLVSLTCRLVQSPDAGNNSTAICEAEAVFRRGDHVQTFSDIGDANPANTNKGIALHLIRMASTRAKARTLRDALNIDGCSAEELTEYEPAIHEDGAPKATKPEALASKVQIDAITREMERAGWNPEQGRSYLQNTCGKQSRSELTQTEAQAFLLHLKGLPAQKAS